MYALIVPAPTPFVLLATVLGLSWWEGRILPTPPTGPVAVLAEAPSTPVAPAQLPEPVGADAALTGDPPFHADALTPPRAPSRVRR
ncbi:hypothetical protein ACWD3I_10825 [Streptomyces sp. NPDC002817]|uniref:hypothetical protein n=1 Tax=Streptomyces sp. NPDC088357 TaxID=3154655 RepID=UPI0034154449